MIFDSLFYHYNCCSIVQAIIVINADSQVDFSPCFPTFSHQAWDFFSANEFFLDACSCYSSYHFFCSHILSRFAKAVNTSSTDKVLNYCFCPRSCLLSISSFLPISKSLSLSGETTLVIHPIHTCSPRPHYFHNFSHCLNSKDNIRTMNQKLSKLED